MLLIEQGKRPINEIVAAMAESVLGVSRHWLTNGSGLMFVDAARGVEMMRRHGKLLDTDDLYYLLQLINIAWSQPVAQDMNTRSRHVMDMLDVLDGWMRERPYPDLTDLFLAWGWYGDYKDIMKRVRVLAAKANVTPCHLAMRMSAALVQYVQAHAIAKEGGLTDTQLRIAVDALEDWIYPVALCADSNKERICLSGVELPLERMMVLAGKKDEAIVNIGDVVRVQSRIQDGEIVGTLFIRDKVKVKLDTRLYIELMQGKRVSQDIISSMMLLHIGNISIMLSPRDYECLTVTIKRVRDNMYYGMALWMYVQQYGYL